MSSLGKRRTVVILLLGLLSLTACATLKHLSELSDELQRAGYRNINVQHNTTNGYDTLSIALVSDTAAQSVTKADAMPVAGIVWNSYQEHIDELRVQLNGEPILITRAELEQQFGARKSGLEEADSGDGTTGLYILLGLVLGGGIILTVILLARRSRRRRPPRQDPPYPTVYPTAPPA